ncbi:MAG: hypothetical protein AAF768_01345 [Pseudomonadota bacterium]
MALLTDVSGDEVEALEFSFQWAVGDEDGLSKYLGESHTPSWLRLSNAITSVVGFFAVLALVLWLFPEVGIWGALMVGVLGKYSSFMYLIAQTVVSKRIERSQALDAKLVGFNHVQVSRDGIYWSTDTGYEYTAWPAVKELILSESEGAIFMYGAMSAHYLPIRLFESSVQFRKVASIIRRYKEHQMAPVHLANETNTDSDATRVLN